MTEKADAGERRRRPRYIVVGDVLWSYATDPAVPQFSGTLLNINELGLCMVSDIPVRESGVLRINAEGLWKVSRFATVMSCNNIGPGLYKAGLVFDYPHKDLSQEYD